MSDELKCPVCGEAISVERMDEYYKRMAEYYIYHDCDDYTFKDFLGIQIHTKEYKTKRGAINAAKRLLNKMKGGE